HRRAPANAAVDNDDARRFLRVGVGGTLEVFRFDGRVGETDGDETDLAVGGRLAVRVAGNDFRYFLQIRRLVRRGRLVFSATVKPAILALVRRGQVGERDERAPVVCAHDDRARGSLAFLLALALLDFLLYALKVSLLLGRERFAAPVLFHQRPPAR